MRPPVLTGAAACLIVPLVGGSFTALVIAAFILGGTSNPLYSLLVAYVNDYLEHEDMASASAGLILLNGVGAMGAPITVGYLMDTVGADAFFYMIFASFTVITTYALWRMTRRAAVPVAETGPMVLMTPVASQVAVDAAWEAAMDQVAEDETESTDAEAQASGAQA